MVGAQLHFLVLEDGLVAVRDCLLGRQGGKHKLHLRLHVVIAHDIQASLLHDLWEPAHGIITRISQLQLVFRALSK